MIRRLVGATGRIAVVGILAFVAPGISPTDISLPGVDPAAGASVTAPPTPGPCTDAAGVTVIVDFTALGGTVQTRCAGSGLADGWAALQAAGFVVRDTTPAQGFVCRIDTLPADESCIGTPPANAYWSYWHAPRGGSWTYSDRGARGRTPPAGSVDAWTFSRLDASATTPPPPAVAVPPALGAGGAGPAPVTAAPAPSATSPEPPSRVAGSVTTPGRPPSTPLNPQAQPAAPAVTAAPPTTSIAATAGPTTVASPPTAEGTTAPGEPTAGAETDDAVTLRAPNANAATDLAAGATGGTASAGDATAPGATGTLVGVVLVALVGLGAFSTSRRRRSTPTDE